MCSAICQFHAKLDFTEQQSHSCYPIPMPVYNRVSLPAQAVTAVVHWRECHHQCAAYLQPGPCDKAGCLRAVRQAIYEHALALGTHNLAPQQSLHKNPQLLTCRPLTTKDEAVIVEGPCQAQKSIFGVKHGSAGALHSNCMPCCSAQPCLHCQSHSCASYPYIACGFHAS